MGKVIVLDKSRWITSRKALEEVKLALGVKRGGHTGTLDPFATGVLPVFTDEATRVIPFLNDEVKEYEATLRLGIDTDTMDLTGQIIREKKVNGVSEDRVKETLSRFRGEIFQIPPMFSALKRDGVRLYKLARRGREVERKPRRVVIDETRLLDLKPPYLRFFVRCSCGTYIRALGADIGKELGCGGHLTELRRLRSGRFRIEDAVGIEDIKEGNYKTFSMLDAISYLKRIEVEEVLAKRIRSGGQIKKSDLDWRVSPDFELGERIRLNFRDELVAVTEVLVESSDLVNVESSRVVLKLIRVFN